MGAIGTTARTRPSRAEIEPAALQLIGRYGAQILSTARRYSANLDDAEDAYQRSLEILLTKAPSTRESDLLPWIKTVVKHEAFALRRQRERHGAPTDHAELTPAAGHGADTHEHVERYERLQVGAEALRRLKPQEVRCLLLLAEGYSYKQIQEITGWTYTKVNRCLSEGRKSFMQRVDGIESGAECARIEPLLSAYADREASEADATAVRRHLRTCLACRASLRETREAPLRVAALAPVGALAVAHGAAPAAGWHPLHAIASWTHERVTMLALRGQDLVEMAGAQKVAAVAASAAAIAGGGVATMQTLEHQPHHHRHVHRAQRGLPAHARTRPVAPMPVRTARPPVKPHRPTRHEPRHAPAAPRSSEPPKPALQPRAPRLPRTQTPSRGDGAGEFGP